MTMSAIETKYISDIEYMFLPFLSLPAHYQSFVAIVTKALQGIATSNGIRASEDKLYVYSEQIVRRILERMDETGLYEGNQFIHSIDGIPYISNQYELLCPENPIEIQLDRYTYIQIENVALCLRWPLTIPDKFIQHSITFVSANDVVHKYEERVSVQEAKYLKYAKLSLLQKRDN